MEEGKEVFVIKVKHCPHGNNNRECWYIYSEDLPIIDDVFYTSLSPYSAEFRAMVEKIRDKIIARLKFPLNIELSLDDMVNNFIGTKKSAYKR